MLIVAVDSHRQSTVYNRYATLIFTNPVFLGFSRYQNVKFGSQRDSFYNFKEITKTLANPVFTRVFLMFAFGEKVAEKWSIFDGSTQI